MGLISPWRPPVLPVTKIWPCPWAFIPARKAWMVWMVPRRLTSRICLIESRDWTSSGPIKPKPALHTERGKSSKRPSQMKQFELMRTYPECPLFSPPPFLLRPGWTVDLLRPFGVFPKYPCGALSRTLRDAPSSPGSSLLHRLNRR